MTPELAAALVWAETPPTNETMSQKFLAILAAEVRRRDAMTCETCALRTLHTDSWRMNEPWCFHAELSCEQMGYTCGAWKAKEEAKP